MKTEITTTITTLPASLLEVDGHHIIAVEHDGTLYAGLACIITPRDGSPLGLQAFTEMDDAGEIPEPVDLPRVDDAAAAYAAVAAAAYASYAAADAAAAYAARVALAAARVAPHAATV
jgi:hypothetical protein